MATTEGIIKYRVHHDSSRTCPENIADRLTKVRAQLFEQGFIGQDPGRYEGYAFGNLSIRLRHNGLFAISGSQTSQLRELDATGYAVITSYDLASNEVTSFGRVTPSSECLTHAVIYAAHPDIMSVLHCHIPLLWQHSQQLALDTTPADAEYGSIAMANAVKTLVHKSHGIFSMSGHIDGIVSYAGSPEEALNILMTTFSTALKIDSDSSA